MNLAIVKNNVVAAENFKGEGRIQGDVHDGGRGRDEAANSCRVCPHARIGERKGAVLLQLIPGEQSLAKPDIGFGKPHRFRRAI